MPHSVAVLQELPLLSNLPQVTVAHLAQHATERAFAKREVVLQKGSSPTALCFLLEGRLQGLDFTMDDREVGLYFVNPGDYFGEVALLDGQPQPEYVTAVSRSRALFIPQDLVKPILYASPKVAETLCTRLSSRLREVSEHRRILGLSNPVQRVCAQLQLLCRDTALTGIHVPNVPTHQELAIMINVSRETVSRVFQLLQGRGIVERQGNDLRVDNLKLLSDIAEGRQLPTA
ncbi:MAG TPA: Crp/Fnr family transcriptional regulator [Comamonas denitrificans]|jgi:CRP-like cAMP-binding protein|nr:Crp/Fnr family transcriptional regulator [Giesbergeria sp.]HRM66022.1 Crp/Fnr family transcriptional regulator [Comamonas denitrificans]